MRYKLIKLIGYAGIYNGMGLTEINIDFTSAVTNKIIIRGSNGSGKSTLINAISVLPDSNDKFMPGIQASKLIRINNGQHDYLIKYIHPVNNNGERITTKGYIAVLDGLDPNGIMAPGDEWKELNPSGNVSSCKELIYEIFGLDNNFIALSSLSSENRGLVDSRPADRKKLLVSILDTLELYNGIYKTVSKKSAAYKQLMNAITYKINNLGNEAQINARLQNVDSRLKALEDEKAMTIEAIAAVKLRLAEYMDILRDNNYDKIVEELNAVSAHNKAILAVIERKLAENGIKDINDIDNFLNYVKQQIAQITASREAFSKMLDMAFADRDKEAADLFEKQRKYESLQSEYNYNELMGAYKATKTAIAEYEKIFHSMGLNNVMLITKTEFDTAMEALKSLKDEAVNVLAVFDFHEIEDYLANEDYYSQEIKKLDSYETERLELSVKIQKLTSDHDYHMDRMGVSSILINRPKECHIDSCPFIKEALEVSKDSNPFILDQIEKDLAETKDLHDSIIDKINQLRRLRYLKEDIDNIRKILKDKMRFISKLPVREDFAETFLTRVVALDPFTDIDQMYRYIDCGNILEEYKVQKTQLDKYESERKIYDAKISIMESLLKDIEELNKKVQDLDAKISSTSQSLKEYNDTITSLEVAKDSIAKIQLLKHDDYDPSKAKEDELLEAKKKIDDNTSEIADLQGKLGQLNTNLGECNRDIKGLSDEREGLRHSLLLLGEYNNELMQYQTEAGLIDKIKYYSSPSTGIQTIFIQLYMNKIISTANSLLALLFDGEFVLQPFIINDTEFRIPCLGNGLLHDDISSMSNAQKSMISMILSFSILHQSSSVYNVIMLDELDGALDTNNRSYFLDLLDRIMNMMHCEQCFMISHNNELNTTACDLILLKNNTNDTYQGHVIWQY